MGTGKYLRALGAGMLLGILPVLVSAEESNAGGVNVLNYLPAYNIELIDSVPRIRQQDDKGSKKGKKDKDGQKHPETDKNKEPKQEPRVVEIDPKKPNIKEVPRARPKLRPGVVTDRVKIKRPPVRVKPGRVLRSIGI